MFDLSSILKIGHPSKPVVELSKKLQIPAGSPLFLVDAPKGFNPGVQISGDETGAAVLVFAVDSKALRAKGDPAIRAAKEGRLSWIAYPKSGQLGTDLHRDKLVQLMRQFGIDGVRLVSVDSVWSAMRFRQSRSG